jgi:serine/threonine protein kinase/tetratricopeptide (TPR) repeat protein
MSDYVGAYQIQQQLGQGGMGVVFQATHAETGLPVALKVMRSEIASTRAHSVFLNEIHQASKLSHPNIAAIFDYGETTDADAAHSSGVIRARQPYIVMELARRGSLDMLDDVLCWRDLNGILQSLLRALAHAHARGILHRDIKPGNILLGSEDDLRPSIKLADFGLALTHNEVVAPNTGLRIVGTPEYMAPEQIEGLWRDQGPWTDLYALGCVAFELASGWAPFTGDSPRQIAIGHLSTPPPPLRPMSVLPEGFEAWVNRTLAKSPADRFQCAADAAYALEQIQDLADGDTPIHGPSRKAIASPTWTFMDIDLPRIPRRSEQTGPATHPEDAPLLIEDWRLVDAKPEPLALDAASLSLVGIKHTRMIGRDAERDILWSTLHEVTRSGYPRAVVVKGAAGLGKRRLATWVTETAHEAGMANSMIARHSELRNPSDGLPRMFAEFLHTRDLSGAAVLARTESALLQHGLTDTYDLEALGRALLATSNAVSKPDTIPSASLSETLALFERVIQQLTVHRPIILHIANAQWAGEALQFAQRLLLERPRPLPVLIVVTCDTEHIQLRQHESSHLEQLCSSVLTQTIGLGPLPEADARSLIETHLQIEPRLARRVEQQSAGSPLFAIQLVEDLVERGVVEPGPFGFRLKEGMSLQLPSSIDTLWTERLHACLATLPDSALEAIRVAAALGVYVDQKDWTAACGALEVDIPDTLISRLARANLIDMEESGWSFTHRLLRHAIAAHAGERWGTINLAAANMLAGQSQVRGMAARIGQHLITANEHEDALPYLMQGAIESWRQGNLYEALNHLDTHRLALTNLQVPETDARWGSQWMERVLVEYNLRRFDLALPLSVQVCDAALKHGWTALQPRAFRYRGMVATAHNEYSEADAMFARAESLVADGDTRELAAIQRHWGMMLRRVGRPKASLARLSKAADSYRRENRIGDLAWTCFNLAELHNELFTDHTRALGLLEEAQKLFEVQKDTMGLADSWNGIAEVHRTMGNLAHAEAAYQESESHFRRAGVDTAVVPLLNRGLLHLERGQYDSAAELLEEVRASLRGGTWTALMPFIHAGLLAVSSARANWDSWDHHEDALRTSLENTTMVERDLASPLERAGDLAQLEGELDRAQRAWILARDQWVALGDESAAERLSRRLPPTSP